MRSFLSVFSLLFLASLHGESAQIEARVLAVDKETRSLEVRLLKSDSSELEVGTEQVFRVAAGDLVIGYMNRTIRASALFYGSRWNLEQIFPIDGLGAIAARDVNQQLRQATASMSRRQFVRQGDYIPNFAMINQQGEFLQIRQLRGKPFVLNFIFTRCAVPNMCPASSERMAYMQSAARDAGMSELNFVTISFDPEFDSPGILNQYAAGYGMSGDTFHLLTGEQSVVDDLLRQFGILTIEEDGTINHTMATLLVDANGRVAFRKEGASWTVEAFIEAASKL